MGLMPSKPSMPSTKPAFVMLLHMLYLLQALSIHAGVFVKFLNDEIENKVDRERWSV
jgi:hypothetical protein